MVDACTEGVGVNFDEVKNRFEGEYEEEGPSVVMVGDWIVADANFADDDWDEDDE